MLYRDGKGTCYKFKVITYLCMLEKLNGCMLQVQDHTTSSRLHKKNGRATRNRSTNKSHVSVPYKQTVNVMLFALQGSKIKRNENKQKNIISNSVAVALSKVVITCFTRCIGSSTSFVGGKSSSSKCPEMARRISGPRSCTARRPACDRRQ